MDDIKIIKVPKEMKNVMVTFKGSVYVRDKYYGHYEEQVITKRGFYSTLLKGYYNAKNEWIDIPEGYFSIPPSWKKFKGILLPHGWGGYRVRPNEVIKWEYCKD
jgi:hypothetical protein